MSVLPEPRGDPVVSPNALQPLANYSNNNTSLWSLNGAVGPTGTVGVSQIVAGTGISIGPTGGTGVVTVSASTPIVSGLSQYVVMDMPTGANSSVRLLDTSDPVKFPPGTDYCFTLTSTIPGASQSACDTTQGQFSAIGIFNVGINNQYTAFLSGSGVNTATATTTNPKDFYLNNNNPISQPPGIYIYSSSTSDFNGCTLLFSWTPVTRV